MKEEPWRTRREEEKIRKRERLRIKEKLEQTWENLRWINRVLEENRVEWRREMKEQRQVTRKEKRRKYKKKEHFRKELDEIRTSIFKLHQIPEMEEPEERLEGWKEDEIHPEGWKEQTGWSQDDDDWMRGYDNHPEGCRIHEICPAQPADDWQDTQENRAENENDPEGWKVTEDTEAWKYEEGDTIEMQMFGYYVEMRRAQFDADSRITALEIIDDCIKHIIEEKVEETHDVSKKGGSPPPSSTPCQDTCDTMSTPALGGAKEMAGSRTSQKDNNPEDWKLASSIMRGFVEIRKTPQPMQSPKIVKKGNY